MEKILLTGNDLTLEQVKKVAKENAIVQISDEAMIRLVSARKLVFDLVDADFPIYGFNVGVGWNKDKKVFKEFFSQYNANLINSHSIAVPPYASVEEVRATMLLRVNTMLFGCTGVAPEIPQILVDMLNLGIHPMIPERSSVGEADLGNLAHIGLAIIGDGTVEYKGKIINSDEAFKLAALNPITLGPKDGLAIVSSNAFGAGQAAVVLYEIEDLLEKYELVYAMSLEGFNGNVSPFDHRNQNKRMYKEQQKVAKRVLEFLQGSYLFEKDIDRPLQDPLSYRDFSQVFGAVWESFIYAKKMLEVQFNSSEDNPCLLLEEKTIVPSANFDPLSWVLPFQMISIALSHVSKSACMRLIKLANPTFTKLPRFLSPGVEVLGFCTVQKTYTILDAEIRHLCMPVSMDTFPLAGDMEDISTNSPLVMQNLHKIIDNLRYIMSLEIIHAAQAVDYRKDKKLGKASGRLYDEVRKIIPFYDKDSNITNMILKIYEFVKSEMGENKCD